MESKLDASSDWVTEEQKAHNWITTYPNKGVSDRTRQQNGVRLIVDDSTRMKRPRAQSSAMWRKSHARKQAKEKDARPEE